jgi:phosphate starvation-inducible PhoH-like protein
MQIGYMKRFAKIPKLSTDAEYLGTIPATMSQPKGKKGKKQKKMNDKEIMKNAFFDNTNDSEQYIPDFESTTTLYKPYEKIIHMSTNERECFEHKFVQPKNESQETYVNILKNKHKKIVVANGPAGTGKTLFATEYGVKYFLTNVVEKLIFTRPSVAVDEDLGYLPGTLEEKMAPWIRPIYDILYKFMSPKEVTQLIEDKVIEIAPLGYMRGRTFQNSWIVADEMQNSTVSQMKMLLTRLGNNSRIIITGDLEQHDKKDELNGLEDFLRRFHGKRSDSISSFEFERKDILREEVVKEVLEIYGGNMPDYSSEDYCDRSEKSEENL